MRVLDIDLDLFLEDTCPLAPVGERPCLEGHRPWSEADVRRFLEDCCGLDRSRPIPGRVFDTHDKALYFWQERIENGTLTVPFAVTHADAHSDLGIGYPGTAPVLSGVLPVRFPERTDVNRYLARKQLDEANYLLYALAFRYVSTLDNVRNLRSKKDIPEELWVREAGADPSGMLTDNPSGASRHLTLHKGGFKENALNKGGLGSALRLTSFAAKLTEGINGPEPVIPYRAYPDPFGYRAEGPFDFMTVAVSPRYAPAEADALLPVLTSYMRQI